MGLIHQRHGSSQSGPVGRLLRSLLFGAIQGQSLQLDLPIGKEVDCNGQSLLRECFGGASGHVSDMRRVEAEGVAVSTLIVIF